MRKKILIAAGFSLLVFTAVWQFALVPRLTERIPSGWTWKAEFIGSNDYPDPETGKLPEKTSTSIYRRQMFVESETGRPRSIIVADTNFTLDPATGKKIWEYNYRAEVDPQTGAHLQKEYAGDYYIFPRFVEKKIYKFRNNYVKGIPLEFRREEKINEVQTYLFSYQGRGEYTESYGTTAEYVGTEVAPGQEIKCDEDKFTFNVWVEPTTGEIIKLYEGCLAADYIFEVATGKRLDLISSWDGETGGDDSIKRAAAVLRERARLMWITRYIPFIFSLAGVLCFGLAFTSGRLSKNEIL